MLQFGYILWYFIEPYKNGTVRKNNKHNEHFFLITIISKLLYTFLMFVLCTWICAEIKAKCGVDLVPVLFRGIRITLTKYLDQIYTTFCLDISADRCMQHGSTNCEKGLYVYPTCLRIFFFFFINLGKGKIITSRD